MALVCLCRGNFYWPPHTTILFCSIFLDKIVLDTLKSRYHRSAPLGIPRDIIDAGKDLVALLINQTMSGAILIAYNHFIQIMPGIDRGISASLPWKL